VRSPFATALAVAGIAAVSGLSTCALAEEPPAQPPPGAQSVAAAPEKPHANPRLKLSYRNFGVASFVDGSTIGLQGAQLDVYPYSRRYFRVGLEAEAGGGGTTVKGNAANLWYGLGGLSIGFQYPMRVTPFVDGRFAAGALGGHYSGAVGQVAGMPVVVDNANATTLMYVGGIDAGVELYAVSRVYVSASLGWAHPVYTGVDYAAMMSNPSGGMQLKQISADTFTFKLGVGI
jgi:hypothetical protein